MNVSAFLLDLKHQGVEISLDGEQLIVRGQKDRLSGDVMQRLKDHKPQIVAFLTEINDSLTSIAPIHRASGDAPIPVSLVQQSYWFLNQLERQKATYNLPMAWRLRGPLNADALIDALKKIVDRHQALRTRFNSVNGVPHQQVDRDASFTVPRVVLSAIDDATLKKYIAEEIGIPFDLSSDLPVRAKLFELSATDHVLVVTMHHIVSDGWSQGIFEKELSILYAEHIGGLTSSLPDLPIQYADFALWQRNGGHGPRHNNGLEYWKDKLADMDPLLPLPYDRSRPPEQSYRGATIYFELSRTLVDSVDRLSRRHGVTTFVTLLAALKVLLMRYSGKNDIAVGTAVANRHRPELESLIGFFANTIVLRTHLTDGLSVSELLTRVQQTCLDAYAHAEIPFDEVVKIARPERSLSLPPIFQVMFRYHNQVQGVLTLPGIDVREVAVDTATAKLDLNISLTESAGGLSANIEYATDLFEPNTIERLVGHYRKLLEAMVTTPSLPISTLAMLSEDEESHLLKSGTGVISAYPVDESIHAIFERQSEATPDQVALVSGAERLTYRELNARANQLAHYLIGRGIGPDMPVGLFTTRSSPLALIGMLGIMKAGGVYVPIDADLPAENANRALTLTQPTLVVANAESRRKLNTTANVIEFEQIAHDAAQNRTLNPPSRVNGGNAAYIVITPGLDDNATVFEHRNIRNVYKIHQWKRLHSADSRVLQYAPIDSPVFMWNSLLALLSGGTLFLTRRESTLGQDIDRLIRHEKITHATLTPPMLATLQAHAYPSLTTVMVTGKDYSETLAKKWSRNRRLLNVHIGPAAVMGTSIYEYPTDGEPIALGQPAPNARVYVLDERHRLCPIGVIGEISIAVAGVARGYLNNPRATAETFVADPYSPAPGMQLHRSGNLGRYLADGKIEFYGSKDRQITLRGFTFDSGKIEKTLRDHPMVLDAVAATHVDSQGASQLTAYLLPQHGSQPPSHNEIRNYLKRFLPSYMMPSTFITLASMPLTADGLIDRSALPNPQAELELRQLAPRTPQEVLLAGIWMQVLEVEQVGINENFFEKGGDSLTIVELQEKLAAATGRDFATTDFFKYPTIRTFAQYMEGGDTAGKHTTEPTAQQPAEPANEMSATERQRNIRLARRSSASSDE